MHQDFRNLDTHGERRSTLWAPDSARLRVWRCRVCAREKVSANSARLRVRLLCARAREKVAADAVCSTHCQKYSGTMAHLLVPSGRFTCACHLQRSWQGTFQGKNHQVRTHQFLAALRPPSLRSLSLLRQSKRLESPDTFPGKVEARPSPVPLREALYRLYSRYA